jgi:hypothetical protein
MDVLVHVSPGPEAQPLEDLAAELSGLYQVSINPIPESGMGEFVIAEPLLGGIQDVIGRFGWYAHYARRKCEY